MANEHPLEGPCDPTLETILHMRPVDGRHLGALCMPLGRGNGSITISSLGSPWGALKRLAKIAKAVATNPAVASLLPPQVNLAIATARKVASLTAPQLRQLIKHPDATPTQKAIANAMLTPAPPAQTSPVAEPDDGAEPEPVESAPEPESEPEPPEPEPESAAEPEPEEYEGEGDEGEGEYQAPAPSSREEHYALHVWGEAAFAPGSWG